jgi:hypothetical protein
MAATYTASACQTVGGFFLNPPKYIEEGYIVRACSITIPISASNTAVIQMVPIPKGAQFHDCLFAWDGAGTTTQFTINVGDGSSTGRYIASFSATASGVVRLGGGVANFSGSGYSYSADDTIDVFVSAVASGSTTPAGTFRLTIMYSMDNNQKG